MQELVNSFPENSVSRDYEQQAEECRPLSTRLIWACKHGLDAGVAVSFFLLFAPLLLLIILLVLVAQGRPVFIGHLRVGKAGKLFPCLKFRTMTNNAQDVLDEHLRTNAEAREEWEATRKLKNDPRVTWLGSYMRKTSIDEIPQLINVLRGEMSLVGPRPIVVEEMKYYGPHIQLYKSVRPGLTGLWQVGGRSDVSYAKRVQLDSDYVLNWTMSLDLAILIRTVPAVVRSKGSY